jgi:hypothetical protein
MVILKLSFMNIGKSVKLKKTFIPIFHRYNFTQLTIIFNNFVENLFNFFHTYN